MKSSERPNVDPITKRLSTLDKTPLIAQAAKENPDFLERVVFQGFDEMLKRFNNMSLEDPLLTIIPKVKELKMKLRGVKIPTLSDLDAKDFVRGIKAAKPLMLMGQDIKKGDLPPSTENKNLAIGSPSMETNEFALLVGTAGHLLERAVFAHLEKQGITDWTKDDILFALEDLVLLGHAEALAGNGKESLLFPYITSPNSLGPEGGVGWRKKEQVDALVQAYNQLPQTS